MCSPLNNIFAIPDKKNTVEYTTVRKFTCTCKEKETNEIKSKYKGNLHSW